MNGASNGCLCGCCAGTSVQTPQTASNLPGLPAIARRVGTWAAFKESFLARLSSSDYPALAPLKTRSDDDFTIALLDASAMVLDILAFYQERLANESYLRTAVQPRSLTELSRLIGYQPAPGVSASTFLAFTIKAAPGQPSNPSAPAITIPAGTRVQSVPAQGQTPQTFETSSAIQAKADWNALAVQTGQRWIPAPADTSIYLAGIATQLNPGDAILIVGKDRIGNPASANWDLCIALSVTPDAANNRTLVTWSNGLAGSAASPAANVPQVYALRQRAALFGYNAIDPNLLSTQNTNINSELSENAFNLPSWTWAGSGNNIDLDAVYPKVVQGGWMIAPFMAPTALSMVSSVSTVARSAYGLSAKVTRIVPDAPGPIGVYSLTGNLVLVQSEELPVAWQPLASPLYGDLLDLADLRPDLAGVQVVAISGARQNIAVADGVTGLFFIPDGNAGAPVSLNPGDVLTLIDPSDFPLPPPPAPDPASGRIPDWIGSMGSTLIGTLSVKDSNGQTGIIQNVAMSQFTLTPSTPGDPVVSEYALVSSVGPVALPYPHTQLQLASPLANCYDRTTATVNANAGPATHGQSVTEIMGSGSASTPDQSFTLRQSPLTYVQAPTPSGRQSTLQVQVNMVTWSEVPTLYGQGGASPVFATLNQADGTTDVLFGDGVEGALLPTGQNNLQASYRIGLGSVGNVAGSTLTTLVDRPLGVSAVTNPEPANGGQDPDTPDDIRSNAPLTVLTLGRAVSITDYQNFAASFAGISKAYAVWIPSGPAQGVFLTVAGVGGAVLPPGSATLSALFTSLQGYGNPEIPITIASYVETLFQFSANVQYDPAYNQASVQAQAFQAVSEAFSFQARTFGQDVSVDELAAVIQGVPGVVAVNIANLATTTSSTGGDISGQGALSLTQWNTWLSASTTIPRLFPNTASQLYAYLPVANPFSSPLPAEILVLDPSLTTASWGVMS